MCFVGERGAAVRVPQWVFERAHAVADVVDALRELGRAFAIRTAQFASSGSSSRYWVAACTRGIESTT